MGIRGFENENKSGEELLDEMGWNGKKEEAPKPAKIEVSAPVRRPVVERAPVSRAKREESAEVPAYVQEAEDKALEARVQRIFGPKSKRDQDDGWEKRQIADLEAYHALLDRRDLEAAQAEIAEARRQFIAVRDAKRAQQSDEKKTG